MSDLKTDVYLASSSLHFLWAYMLAEQNKGQRESHLVLVDQYAGRPMAIAESMTPDISPFASMFVLEGRELSGTAKINMRNSQILWVLNFVKMHSIDRVLIGNDRSVIGQFFVKEVKKQGSEIKACYLDDGVYSYLGRADSRKPSEKYIDTFLRKFMYGFWYDHPSTVGTSKYIDEAWVMYPAQINSLFSDKDVKEILQDKSVFEALIPLGRKVLADFEILEDRLADIDVIFTLANKSIFSKIDNYQSIITERITGLIDSGKRVAVKYHPAQGEEDFLELEKLGAWRLPANINFELLIPFIKDGLLIGDLSTTVLMANYANNLDAEVLVYPGFEDSHRMMQLCQALKIKTTSI